MEHSIMNLFIDYDIDVAMCDSFIWDRQTIVMVCDNDVTLNNVRNMLRHNRKPNSVHNEKNYSIDGFVNLNYSPNERDPAKRNVRIVYCNMERIKYGEICRRFQGSYIMRVRRKEVNIDGTPRISREIPKISG